MEFFQSDTKIQLAWDQVWGQVKPVSAPGRRRHSEYKAFLPPQVEELAQELNRLEELSRALEGDPAGSSALSYLLANVRDVSLSLKRAQGGSVLDDLELYEIKRQLSLLAEIKEELKRQKWEHLLPVPADLCTPCLKALSIGQGGRDSFYIADAYDADLAAVREKRIFLETTLAEFKNKAEEKLLRAAGRGFGPGCEISVSRGEQAVIAQLAAMRELKKTEETNDFVKFRLAENETVRRQRQELRKFREKEETYKARVRQNLSQVVAEHGERLLKMQEVLGYLDLLLAKAKFCAGFGGVKPHLSRENVLRFKKGRHLLVEKEVAADGYDYRPIDVCLKPGATIITGPNMGGKTVSLKTIGLLAAMAQYGLLVPAEAMEFRPLWFVASHLARAEIPRGLSTFAAEIVFLQNAVEKSGTAGLILVDEIAHGTNPQEGAALAGAVVERLHSRPAYTVVTTHYPPLARLQGPRQLRVAGLDEKKVRKYSFAGREDILRRFMDYNLVPWQGPADCEVSGDAALVAETMGLDAEIIARAKGLLKRGWEDLGHD
ncbi:MAG TPA: hypothetical protein GX528_06055 [Firmicutes bacterium]|nr:hypothetical protein [Bacillota bacterium]